MIKLGGEVFLLRRWGQESVYEEGRYKIVTLRDLVKNLETSILIRFSQFKEPKQQM